MRDVLIVQAAQRMSPRTVDRAALHDAHRRTVLGELALTEGPSQESSLVGVAFHVDQIGALEPSWGEDHRPEARGGGRLSSISVHRRAAASGAHHRVGPPPEALGPG